MKLFLAPHNDDETLFGAFTLMREKPLVVIVTDSYIQSNRGENITAFQRWMETYNAMKLLGCSVISLGLRDDVLEEWAVIEKFSKFANFDKIYAPAIQGGNKDHDMVGKIAMHVWPDKTKQYCTYTPTELYTTGSEEIVPTLEELDLKFKALQCYKSQFNLPATKPHFEAVLGHSEWFI